MRAWGVTAAAVELVPESLVPVLLAVTATGDPMHLAVLSTAGGVGAWLRGWASPATVRRFLVAVALALSASVLLKHGLALPRPPATMQLVPADGYGFPSGHAIATAGVGTALYGVVRRRWVGVAAAAWILAIGATRVLLGVHYLGDVLVGIAVGVVVAGVGLALDRRRPRIALPVTAVIVGLALLVWLVGQSSVG